MKVVICINAQLAFKGRVTLGLRVKFKNCILCLATKDVKNIGYLRYMVACSYSRTNKILNIPYILYIF